MQISKLNDETYTGKLVYIIESVDYGGYDSWEIGYHLTKVGAIKTVLAYTRDDWEKFRTPEGMEYACHYYIREARLSD